MIWLDGRDYINCSRIRSSLGEEPGLIIATQGPMHHTQRDFWRLVIQEKSTFILSLAHDIGDAENSDCVQYFPINAQESMLFGHITVTCIKL
jgi:protein tyrosine phosphatase